MKKEMWLAIIAGLVLCAAILLTPILLLGSALGGISAQTEHARIESPDGSRWAVLIESDQGALGGATIVRVEEKPTKILFFTIPGKTERVYLGPWGEHEFLKLEWKNEKILLIDGKEYAI